MEMEGKVDPFLDALEMAMSRESSQRTCCHFSGVSAWMCPIHRVQDALLKAMGMLAGVKRRQRGWFLRIQANPGGRQPCPNKRRR